MCAVHDNKSDRTFSWAECYDFVSHPTALLGKILVSVFDSLREDRAYTGQTLGKVFSLAPILSRSDGLGHRSSTVHFSKHKVAAVWSEIMAACRRIANDPAIVSKAYNRTFVKPITVQLYVLVSKKKYRTLEKGTIVGDSVVLQDEQVLMARHRFAQSLYAAAFQSNAEWRAVWDAARQAWDAARDRVAANNVTIANVGTDDGVDGTFQRVVDEEFLFRGAPVYELLERDDRFLFLAIDNHWWVSDEGDMRQRAASGYAHTAYAVAAGTLPWEAPGQWGSFSGDGGAFVVQPTMTVVAVVVEPMDEDL